MSSLTLNFEIDDSSESSLKSGASKVLEKVRPNWRNISFKIYTDGITNKLVGAWNDSDSEDQVLIRVYGVNSDLFIDRKAEADVIKILHKNALAPDLLASFKNGISYGFVPGVPLTTESVREEKIWKGTAQQMASFHKVKIDSKVPCLFEKLNQFYVNLPEQFTAEQNKRLTAAGLSKTLLKMEIDSLAENLSLKDCPVVFSHNDLLLGNIVWNEQKGTVHFIDFEFGAPNYQPFDIGNHFAEFPGIDNVDYSLYPDENFQKKWIRHYLCHYYDKGDVEQSEVDRWFKMVNEFSVAAHLLWGTLALFQASNSTIDFDFFGYGIIRLQEYHRRKPLIFKK